MHVYLNLLKLCNTHNPYYPVVLDLLRCSVLSDGCYHIKWKWKCAIQKRKHYWPRYINTIYQLWFCPCCCGKLCTLKRQKWKRKYASLKSAHNWPRYKNTVYQRLTYPCCCRCFVPPPHTQFSITILSLCVSSGNGLAWKLWCNTNSVNVFIKSTWNLYSILQWRFARLDVCNASRLFFQKLFVIISNEIQNIYYWNRVEWFSSTRN